MEAHADSGLVNGYVRGRNPTEFCTNILRDNNKCTSCRQRRHDRRDAKADSGQAHCGESLLDSKPAIPLPG